MSLRKDIAIAAQDCALDGMGAHTGETCASQLKDLGVTWVILGHSERREGFGMAGEDSELVAKKTKKALEEGLKVMLCIGEKKEEREAGTTMDVCAEQLKPAAAILSKEDWANVSSELFLNLWSNFAYVAILHVLIFLCSDSSTMCVYLRYIFNNNLQSPTNLCGQLELDSLPPPKWHKRPMPTFVSGWLTMSEQTSPPPFVSNTVEV